MRKIHLLSILLPLCVWAGPVDVETARQQAAIFFNKQAASKSFNGKSSSSEQRLKLLYAQQDTPEAAPQLYIFGQEEGEGYVVIAGDDVANTPVLGYSKTGTFNADSIPENLRYWLSEYGKQIAFVRDSSISVVGNSQPETSRDPIEPLITSKWGQGAPYNNLCPIDPNTGLRSDAGCVATALAQIMYYHKWPEQGIDSHSYVWEGQTLSADFSATTYQWDKMKDTYSLEDDDPDNAVATLMYHCGVAVNSWYSSNGTAVTITNSFLEDRTTIVDVLKYYFNFSKGVVASGVDPNNDETLYEELHAKRPVLIAGGTHVFICDGYENGYYHFNFGWSGYCDDYFLLSAIDPDNKYYSLDLNMTYGIRKDFNRQTIDDIFYELYEDGTARIVNASVEGECTIPSSIQLDGKMYEVTAINYEAFRECSGLTSVTIPNNITSIGCSAFRFCSNLQSVTLSNNITKISNYAFDGCSNLNRVIIPDNVISVGAYSFQNCTNLASVTIPNSVAEIGWGAFEGCGNLTTPIYTSTTFISMPISYEGEYVIPDGITKIAPSAFYQCTKLTSVTIPNSVTSIGDMAFQGCSNASLNIPASVTEIGQFAFAGCNGLTSLFVTKDVTFIGLEAFNGCNNLTSIIVEEGHDTYDSRNNCNAIIESATNTLLYGCNNTVIPNDITDIGEGAFAGFCGFATINIPNSVKTIDQHAFVGCDGLISMEIPEGVTEIYMGVFNGCKNLTSVSFPNSIEFLASCIFQNCTGLKNVILPENLSYIPNSMFWGCSSLTSITIPNGVTEIQGDSFYDCTSLTSIDFPNSVKTIGSRSFFNCKNLTSVIFPGSVEYINPLAFWGCTKLESIKVEESNSIYDSRNNCNAIIETASNTLTIGCKNTTIPYGVEAIGPSAFQGCSSLTSLTIPESVTSIGEYAFLGCKNLQSLIIPKNVTTIGGWCFYECENLTTLTLPQNIASIGRIILYGSNSLKDLYCLATEVPKVVDDAFEYVDFENVTLHVPAESREDYWVTVPWSFFRKISPIIKGDVNADEEVDVLDVVDIARFVVGTPAITFMELFADINKDGNVNIGDAVALVNVIAGDQDFASSRHVQPLTTTDALSLTEKEGRLSLSLENRCDYTAFQFDLYLPDDIDVKQMLLNEGRKNGHQLLYNKVENGHYRVAALSTSNHTFNGDDGELLNIALDGMIGDATIISNVHFFDAKGNDYLFKEMDSTPTGIFEKENTLESIGGTIYDTQGRKLKHLQKGINIVEGKKVFVK